MTGPLCDDGRPDATVGCFTYRIADQAWTWSDGVYRLLGHQPHAVPATTETLLRHRHPEEASSVLDALDTAVRDGRPFSCYHRILDAAGRVRSVVAVGHAVRGEDGSVESLAGFYADLTDVRRRETEADVEVALRRIAEHRPVIEQAKGVVMVATGCDPDAAFDVLRRYSMTHNVKLHDVARELVSSIGSEVRPSHETCASVMERLERLAPRATSTLRVAGGGASGPAPRRSAPRHAGGTATAPTRH